MNSVVARLAKLLQDSEIEADKPQSYTDNRDFERGVVSGVENCIDILKEEYEKWQFLKDLEIFDKVK